MNRMEAEDFVYRFYMEKIDRQNFFDKDSQKRHPELSREMIRKRNDIPCAVVTGSKGKGSISCMISEILSTEYRTGLMTSPHIADFCERFRVDGVLISDDEFAGEMTQLAPEITGAAEAAAEDQFLSPMGVQTVLALSYFKKKNAQFCVLECGKGAKYDDVNNTLHAYAVINTIFPEHLRELGDDVLMIARDKAHVITGEQKAVYVGPQQDAVMEAIRERAKRFGVPLYAYGNDFWAEHIAYTDCGMRFDVCLRDPGTGEIKRIEGIKIPLLGEHQARNCALALALCLDVLSRPDMEKIKKKLRTIRWPGRMEIISVNPVTILDACINRTGCAEIKRVLRHLSIERIVAIVGIPDDKDYAGVIREMAQISEQIILTKSQNPHYRFSDAQCDVMRKEGIFTTWTDCVEEAVALAAQRELPIVICGTTSVIAEIYTSTSSCVNSFGSTIPEQMPSIPR